VQVTQSDEHAVQALLLALLAKNPSLHPVQVPITAGQALQLASVHWVQLFAALSCR